MIHFAIWFQFPCLLMFWCHFLLIRYYFFVWLVWFGFPFLVKCVFSFSVGRGPTEDRDSLTNLKLSLSFLNLVPAIFTSTSAYSWASSLYSTKPHTHLFHFCQGHSASSFSENKLEIRKYGQNPASIITQSLHNIHTIYFER